MKVKANSSFAVHWPNGDMWSPTPGQEIEISDKDVEKVDFLYDLSDSGHITVIEEAVEDKPKKTETSSSKVTQEAPKKDEVKTSEGARTGQPANKAPGR